MKLLPARLQLKYQPISRLKKMNTFVNAFGAVSFGVFGSSLLYSLTAYTVASMPNLSFRLPLVELSVAMAGVSDLSLPIVASGSLRKVIRSQSLGETFARNRPKS